MKDKALFSFSKTFPVNHKHTIKCHALSSLKYLNQSAICCNSMWNVKPYFLRKIEQKCFLCHQICCFSGLNQAWTLTMYCKGNTLQKMTSAGCFMKTGLNFHPCLIHKKNILKCCLFKRSRLKTNIDCHRDYFYSRIDMALDDINISIVLLLQRNPTAS